MTAYVAVRITVTKRRVVWLTTLLDLVGILFGGGPVADDGEYRVDVHWPDGTREKVICQTRTHAQAVKERLEAEPNLTTERFASLERGLPTSGPLPTTGDPTST